MQCACGACQTFGPCFGVAGLPFGNREQHRASGCGLALCAAGKAHLGIAGGNRAKTVMDFAAGKISARHARLSFQPSDMRAGTAIDCLWTGICRSIDQKHRPTLFGKLAGDGSIGGRTCGGKSKHHQPGLLAQFRLEQPRCNLSTLGWDTDAVLADSNRRCGCGSAPPQHSRCNCAHRHELAAGRFNREFVGRMSGSFWHR